MEVNTAGVEVEERGQPDGDRYRPDGLDAEIVALLRARLRLGLPLPTVTRIQLGIPWMHCFGERADVTADYRAAATYNTSRT